MEGLMKGSLIIGLGKGCGDVQEDLGGEGLKSSPCEERNAIRSRGRVVCVFDGKGYVSVIDSPLVW